MYLYDDYITTYDSESDYMVSIIQRVRLYGKYNTKSQTIW